MNLKNVCQKCVERLEKALCELVNHEISDQEIATHMVDFIDEKNGKIYTISMNKSITYKSEGQSEHENETV